MLNRQPRRIYEFAPFRLDLEERLLLRDGVSIPLAPKVFEVLVALVENSGRTVRKDVLMSRVWADSFVEEGSLTRSISTLRKVLGEDANEPRIIKTVPKLGYRLDLDVREILEHEEVEVETRTKLRFSLRQETARASWLSLRYVFVIAAVFVAGTGAVWFAVQPPASDALLQRIELERGTSSEEAFSLYQNGRKLWESRRDTDLHRATQYLERAVRIDPQFARGHAALADAYAFSVALWPKAEAAANEAMRLDPGLAGPHATIGFVRTFWEWKLADGGTHFRRAIELDPQYATAHQWNALNFAARRKTGSAIAEIEIALELEPTSAAINTDLCQILYFARKYAQAAAQCQKTLTLDPDFLPAHQLLYEIYSADGRHSEAVEKFFDIQDRSMTTQAHPSHLARLKEAFSSGGIREFWEERTRFLSDQNPTENYRVGQYYSRLERPDEALRSFSRAAAVGDFSFLFFAADPIHQGLASDPRYAELIARLEN